MEIVHSLGVPTFTWYGHRLQTGRSHFQLVWKSITNCAFPLSAGMGIVHGLGVHTFMWYGNHLQTGRSHFQLVRIQSHTMRSHFQLVWKSFAVWAFPLSPGMEIDYWAFLLSAGMEIDYKLCVPTLSWYGNRSQSGRSHVHLVWKLVTNWAFPLSTGMEINYKRCVWAGRACFNTLLV